MLITPTQAARFAQVHEADIRHWIEEGRLPAFEPSRGLVRIRGNDFADFLAQSRTRRRRRAQGRI